jgi:hypothetical protein
MVWNSAAMIKALSFFGRSVKGGVPDNLIKNNASDPDDPCHNKQ